MDNILFNWQETTGLSVQYTFSEWMLVLSGIPQGSVLGQLLFVIYINELPRIVKSTIYLFADDTKIYRSINNPEDTKILQEYLDKLQELWSKTWLLKFHPDKCKRMTIGRQTKNTKVSHIYIYIYIKQRRHYSPTRKY